MLRSALGGLQQRAQRRLLVEAELAFVEDGTSGDVAKQDALADGSTGELGAEGPPRGAPCPSRDRARAWLRRLHPTAWLCAEPAASSVAEPGVLKPASRLLQAATAAAGDSSSDTDVPMRGRAKRLPWAHLAAREQAAADALPETTEVMQIAASGQAFDAAASAGPAAPTLASELSWAQRFGGVDAPPQDWSWLASPPWGVAPLPPELAARVDAGGRLLLPGTPGDEAAATAAAASAAVTVALPAPLPCCRPEHAQLHQRLQQTSGAVQQVLAVAAAAAQRAAVAGVPAMHNPLWQIISKWPGPHGRHACSQLAKEVHAHTASKAILLAGALNRPPPVTLPATGEGSPALESLAQDLVDAAGALDEDLSRRIQVGHVASLFLQSPPPATSATAAVGDKTHEPPLECSVLAMWGDGRSELVKDYLAVILTVFGAPLGERSVVAVRRGESRWRLLARRVVAWAPFRGQQLWRWLLEAAADAEEAKFAASAVAQAGTAAAAGRGPGTGLGAGAEEAERVVPGRSGGAGGDIVQAFGSAAEEVLRAATCALLMMLLTIQQCKQVGQEGTTQRGHEAGYEPWVPCKEEDLFSFDPLSLAAVMPTYLLARAEHPDMPISPFELCELLRLGQLPIPTPLHMPPGAHGSRSSMALARPAPHGAAALPPASPPPPLSYEHCRAAADALAQQPDVVYAWVTELVNIQDPQPEHVAVVQMRAWVNAWVAHRQERRQRRQRRAEERAARWQALGIAWRAGGTAALLDALLAEDADGTGGSGGGGSAGHDTTSGGGAGELATADGNTGGMTMPPQQRVPPPPPQQQQQQGPRHGGSRHPPAELVLDLEAAGVAARSLRLTCVMAAAPQLKPAARALAAALRGVCLLRIPPAASAPAPPLMTAQDARIAAAGLAAVVSAPGGGCDVLRARFPAGDAPCLASLMLCMPMESLSTERAIADSGACVVFQPVPTPRRAKAPQPQPPPPQPQSRRQQERGEHQCGAQEWLEVDICRAFVPLWSLKSGPATWPYPWEALSDAGGVAHWNTTTTLDAMVAHLRRFLVQLGTGICAAHVRGVEALGRTVAALAKVREELRDGAKGAAARDAVGYVATIIDFGDEPQSTAQTAADAAAAGCAADDTRPGVDGVEKGADEEDDSSVDGDYAEGGAGTPKQRRPRLGTLARAWDDTYVAAAEVEPLLPEERLQHELPSAATVAAADVAVAAAAAAARAKPQRPEEERQRRRQQRLVDSDGGGSSGGGGAGTPLPPPPPLVLVEPRPGLSHQQLQEQRGSDGAESVTSLEIHLAKMVYLLQGQHVPAPAAAAATAQHQQGEEQPEEGGGRRRKEQQPQQSAPRQKQPWLDVELDVWFLEVAPGAPWQLMPPSKAVIQGLNRAMEKEKLARHAK
ncbi:hypothetical protein HYH02_009106 [Chlamydomonas schloesseri]|uniref:Uncharacterized protein n=1 Tax=Chlamydomonas schloesseri TaxID=2026947 RepID=A0A835WB70_9CHLO|nr:hypothetical protein HYH02_009106 [Chlamydomonas schloesseri]|eukprot:KAG2444167.1 hypothetical protein HYH02_009106 [Chlamydomonas schloesseri]